MAWAAGPGAALAGVLACPSVAKAGVRAAASAAATKQSGRGSCMHLRGFGENAAELSLSLRIATDQA